MSNDWFNTVRLAFQVDISNQINETNCFLNQYLLPTNKDFFLLFFWINILPSSLLSSYYLLPLACFDMWFRTKCFSMKKIDYAKKTHLSFFLFVCRVGTPLHLVHRRTKKFPFQLQPRWRGVKGGLHVLFFFRWLFDQVIYLKPRKKYQFCKADDTFLGQISRSPHTNN